MVKKTNIKGGQIFKLTIVRQTGFQLSILKITLLKPKCKYR